MPAALVHPRTLLTLVLVIPVLLCCCSGRLVGQLLGTALNEAVAVEAVAGPAPHACCAADRAPDAPPGQDERPCDCEQSRQAKQLPETAPSPEWPGAPLALVLPSVPVSRAVVMGIGTRAVLAGDVPKPPSSLLRQRCALVI